MSTLSRGTNGIYSVARRKADGRRSPIAQTVLSVGEPYVDTHRQQSYEGCDQHMQQVNAELASHDMAQNGCDTALD